MLVNGYMLFFLKKKILILLFIHLMIALPFRGSALAQRPVSVLSGIAQVGMAFMTNLAIHEGGHLAVADYVGAKGSSMNFFTSQNGQFFLGLSNVKEIDDRSRLPYSMGGEAATNLTFEYALYQYKKEATVYNKALLLFSGTDFLRYSLYAFYLTDGDSAFDPNAVADISGISKDIIFSTILAQTLLNSYRVYSGQDRFFPYIALDKFSATFNFRFNF